VSTPASEQSPRLARVLSPFRRVTTSGGFIAEIDGLRFIAIFVVVLFHLAVGLSIKSPAHYARTSGNWLGAVAWNGFRGVELFFVISGFILALPFAGHSLKGRARVDLRQYFLRRVTRLEPPYVLAMVLLFALHVLVRDRSAAQLWPHLAAGLVYGHNLIFGTENLINNVAWSLEVEIQFYLLTPLLTLLFAIEARALRRTVIIGLCLLSVALGSLYISPGDRAHLTIARFLHFFLVGYLLADIYLTDWGEEPARQWTWDLVSLVGWPLLFAAFNAIEAPAPGHAPVCEPALVAFFVPFAIFLLYCAVFRGRLTNRALTNPWITTIGGMCYTIYLLHNPALAMINNLTKGIAPTGSYAVNLIVQLMLATPLLLLPCAAYFVLIEKPCMRRDWPRRLVERFQSPRPVADPE
jgi:peptidoglycan/LPS O-acetylase OafA/YrhL